VDEDICDTEDEAEDGNSVILNDNNLRESLSDEPGACFDELAMDTALLNPNSSTRSRRGRRSGTLFLERYRRDFREIRTHSSIVLGFLGGVCAAACFLVLRSYTVY